VNELEVIEIIKETVLGSKEDADLIGDDVALFQKGKLVIKTDMLVSTTDMPSQMTLAQAAKKAVAMCISDFAAKGVRPSGYLISLGIPAGYSKKEIQEIAKGLKEASEKWDVKLVGGDTNLAKELIISCTMFGFSEKVVGRKGASLDELVVTNGYFGYPAVGLRILTSEVRSTPKLRRKAVSSVLNPEPRLDDGLVLSKYLTSSMDSSDGLAICLHTLAERNNIRISVTKIPVRKDVVDFASRNGIRVKELAFFGGEEYLIVGTMKKADFPIAKREIAKVGGELVSFGYTSKGKGVFVESNGSYELPKKGWVYSF
jgi:thiamine-monophosphate kinase